jgi:hypothetical protein
VNPNRFRNFKIPNSTNIEFTNPKKIIEDRQIEIIKICKLLSSKFIVCLKILLVINIKKVKPPKTTAKRKDINFRFDSNFTDLVF